jgi:hypothetical protein
MVVGESAKTCTDQSGPEMSQPRYSNSVALAPAGSGFSRVT